MASKRRKSRRNRSLGSITPTALAYASFGKCSGAPDWKKEMRLRPCFYCGKKRKVRQKGGPPAVFGANQYRNTIDHIVPLSKNGSDAAHNAVPCCDVCNQSKGSRTLKQWREQIKRNERDGARKARILTSIDSLLARKPPARERPTTSGWTIQAWLGL